jgi:hypothetical protein
MLKEDRLIPAAVSEPMQAEPPAVTKEKGTRGGSGPGTVCPDRRRFRTGNLEDEMMIINTGMRTDIPAFYADWFANRLKEGFVYVRNPYNMTYITKYLLNPSVVDIICFCSKNSRI